MTHIYWFSYFNDSEPSVRYRCLYPLQQLEQQHNITSDIVIPGWSLSCITRFIIVYLSVIFFRKPGSAIVIQKVHTNRLYASLLKLLVRLQPGNSFYDIDDADYLKFPPSTIHYFMQHCGTVCTGSNSISQYSQQFNPRTNILSSPVIPHNHIKQHKNQLFTIGWIGYYNAHRESLLNLFFPALQHITFPVRLVLLGVTKPAHIAEVSALISQYPHVSLHMPQNINWLNEEAIYQHIVTFDIGIAPLLNTPVNCAKSAFKMKQYLSCGIPVLASPVGENATFLRTGYNGYTCSTPADYLHSINYFHSLSYQQYQTYSANALTSSQSFAMAAFCRQWAALLAAHHPAIS